MNTRLSALLDRLEEVISTLLVWALVVVGVLGVVFRFLVSIPLIWSEELARILFTWMVFIGAAMATRRGGHISIDFVYRRMPKRFQGRWLLATDLVVLIVLAILIVQGIRLIQITYFTQTSALEISWAWVYVSLPICCGFMAMSHLRRAVARCRQMLAETNR